MMRSISTGRPSFGRLVSILGVCALAGAPGGCGDDDSQESFVHQECPGDPGCPESPDDTLYAGAAAVDITPPDLKEGPSFVDANGNGLYNSSEGDTFVDANGNGELDAVWMAGFSPGRPAVDVLHPLQGRVVAMRQGETTVVWIGVDLIGFFWDYVQAVRERLDPAVAEQVDLLLISSSHTHHGPDTVGIWGPRVTVSGLDPDYLDYLGAQLAQGVAEAVASLEEANVTFGAIALEDPDGSLDAYMHDSRDPVIIDNTLRVMRFFRPATDETIATVVNLGLHPEYFRRSNNLLTPDYVHYLREAVESGDATGIQGIGGVCVFVAGTVGGLISPGGVTPRDRNGQPVTGDPDAKAQAGGESYAEFALRALSPEHGAVTEARPTLYFRTRRVFAHVDNLLYQAAWRLGSFDRGLYHFDPEAALDETNTPEIETELVYMRLGPASFVSLPGELAPELFVGGYDGSHSGTYDIISPSNPNPPNLALAPDGPYLQDLIAQTDGSLFQWPMGLTQDEVGYLLPDYNYQIDPDIPYLVQPPGDHYCETNSLGPRARQELIGPLEELILLP